MEYNVAPICSAADAAHWNAQLTDLDLVGATASGYKYAPCVPDPQAVWQARARLPDATLTPANAGLVGSLTSAF